MCRSEAKAVNKDHSVCVCSGLREPLQSFISPHNELRSLELRQPRQLQLGFWTLLSELRLGMRPKDNGQHGGIIYRRNIGDCLIQSSPHRRCHHVKPDISKNWIKEARRKDALKYSWRRSSVVRISHELPGFISLSREQAIY